MARRLNRSLLHPAIAEEVWLSFIRGRFAAAVFEPMPAVEIAVREAAGFPEGEQGILMIRKAFHKDTGPLRDPGQEEAEREALMRLFAGAVGSYWNPHSHRGVAMEDAGEAIETVMLARHLLHIVDARKPTQQEIQRDEARSGSREGHSSLWRGGRCAQVGPLSAGGPEQPFDLGYSGCVQFPRAVINAVCSILTRSD